MYKAIVTINDKKVYFDDNYQAYKYFMETCYSYRNIKDAVIKYQDAINQETYKA